MAHLRNWAEMPLQPRATGKSPRLVVYTCIFGAYGRLRPVQHVEPGVSYLCFTDNPHLRCPGWQIRTLDLAAAGLVDASPILQSRYAKILPHRALPEFAFSIYLDENFDILAPLSPLLGFLDARHPIAFFKHPSERKDVYAEAEICARLGKDTEERLSAQTTRYRAEGFGGVGEPGATMIPAAALIVRRHRDREVVETMETWWREFTTSSRRDQISLPYALWRHRLPHVQIDVNMRRNAYVRRKRPHDKVAAAKHMEQAYQNANAIILYAPGSGEDVLAAALAQFQGGQGRVIVDANYLALNEDAPGRPQLLLADLMERCEVALLRREPENALRARYDAKRAEGYAFGSLAEFAASPIYGLARRRTFLDLVERWMIDHTGTTTVFDFEALGRGEIGSLAGFLNRFCGPVETSSLRGALADHA